MRAITTRALPARPPCGAEGWRLWVRNRPAIWSRSIWDEVINAPPNTPRSIPTEKMPTLENDGIVLWESNAILFYTASKRPGSGVWPSDLKRQADVVRWFLWESAH